MKTKYKVKKAKDRCPRCQDPDHSAVNAERAEARVLRAECVRLDDLRQKLEKENAELKSQIASLQYWRDISECDCSSPLPNGGCLRCDLDRILSVWVGPVDLPRMLM